MNIDNRKRELDIEEEKSNKKQRTTNTINIGAKYSSNNVPQVVGNLIINGEKSYQTIYVPINLWFAPNVTIPIVTIEPKEFFNKIITFDINK